MMQSILYVAVGGSLGAVIRFLFGHYFGTTNFPWHTLVINVLGSLLIGIFWQWQLTNKINSNQYLLLGIGFCGGFTTFSSFSLENIKYLQNNQLQLFFLYSSISFVTCIVATWLGMLIAKQL